MRFVDLNDLPIPRSVIEMIPEAVARENCLIPISFRKGVLCVAVADAAASDSDLLQKLAFILDFEIEAVLADRQQILAAIDRHFGRGEYDAWVWE